MSETTTIAIRDSAMAHEFIDATAIATTTTTTRRARTNVPASIPRDQLYYWSIPWQGDIRESMDALAAGDYVDFDSDDPADVVRWFLNDDE